MGRADSFRAQRAEHQGRIPHRHGEGTSLAGGRTVVVTDQGEIEAKALIIATGANFRKQGCPGEKRIHGQGRFLLRVGLRRGLFEELGGGGFIGGQYCRGRGLLSDPVRGEGLIVHRRDQFRADKLAAEHASKNPKIVPLWDSVLEAIEGDGLVERMVLKNVKSGEKNVVAVNGVFIFIGTLPNAALLSGVCETTEQGWIITDADMRTSTPGIFAAGDVRDTALRQVLTAAGDGARAAMSAYAYLAEQE